jgi:hypothetical protein
MISKHTIGQPAPEKSPRPLQSPGHRPPEESFQFAWDEIYLNYSTSGIEFFLNSDHINLLHPVYGMTLLHLACAIGNLPAAKLLVERGAQFIPDSQGRMPSIIAADAEASPELCDFIVEAEAKATA